MSDPVAGMQLTASLRLLRELGAGGMGRVWVAESPALGKVVVKLMSPELVRNDELFERFSREAAAAARVQHPHVVRMHDIGVAENGQPFIVMERLEGEDLADRLTRVGRLGVPETVEIVTQVASALAAAHAKGVVHRDVKPANIFLCSTAGEGVHAKVLDFGLAKIAAAPGKLTVTGALMGTPAYMSAEQLRGAKQVDHRSDLWSLAVVAYRALTGKRPFAGETFAAVAMSVYGKPAPRPSTLRPGLPPAFDDWFACAVQIDPAQRFASADALANALHNATRGATPEEDTLEAPPSDPDIGLDGPSDAAPTRVRLR